MASRDYTTRRSAIVNAFVEKLDTIDGTGKFRTVVASTSPRLLFWDEIAEFPAVHVNSGSETREYLGAGEKFRFLTLTFRCYVNEKDAVDALEMLLEDVETVIEDNNPILGVVYVPAKSLLYLAEKNKGSFKINTKDKLENLKGIQKILVSNQSNRACVIGSRSHSNATFDNWVKEKFPNADIVQAGSSLKFCLIAEGEADIYPRFGPTSEWDIAAGHIIVNEAGGKIRTFQNDSIKYNTKENIINPEFYAIGNIDLN